MTWTYDPSDLDTTTESGRLNVVRLTIGDTNSSDQKLQNEELAFYLSINNDDYLLASRDAAITLYSKYAGLADVELDGELSVSYEFVAEKYKELIRIINATVSSKLVFIGVEASGVKRSEVYAANQLIDRVIPAFWEGQFDNTEVEE